MVQIDEWKTEITFYINKITIQNDRLRVNKNDLKYSESNGWAGLSIGLVLVTFIAVGACYSLHNRRKEDESAENEFDEGGEIDDYYLKV